MLADRRLVIAVLGLVVILPLCFPRELGALSWVSAAAVRLPETAACAWVLERLIGDEMAGSHWGGCLFMRASHVAGKSAGAGCGLRLPTVGHATGLRMRALMRHGHALVGMRP